MLSRFQRSLGRRLRHAANALFERPDTAPTTPVYLVSAGGQPNFGDEFITRAWIDWLAEHHPGREVWLDTIEPGRAAHLYRNMHPRLRTTNTLWHAAHSAPRGSLTQSAEHVSNLVTSLGSPRFDSGLRDLRTMSSIHLLGGGYMNSIWPENLGILAALTTLRREFGVRLFATGQGLLPNDGEAQQWVAEQLAEFDFVESRDREGAKAFDIHAGTDDAFLAFANRRPIYAPAAQLPEKMVLIQGDMVAEDESAITAAITSFIGEGGPRVGFAEAIPPEDLRFAQAYLDEDAELFFFLRMWEEGFPARAGQTWFTSRFHFHLLAAAAGARGMVLNVRTGYYDVKHALLEQLGTGWGVLQGDVDPRAVIQANATASDDFPRIARVLGQEKSRLASELYPLDG